MEKVDNASVSFGSGKEEMDRLDFAAGLAGMDTERYIDAVLQKAIEREHKYFTENAKMFKNIVLIRHGESESNAGLPTFDHEKIPLTEKGRAQAEKVAGCIPFVPELTVSSPFSRARSTALQTLLRFSCTKFEVWPEVREFTYLSPATCAGTTSADRKPRVEAYWNAADPDYVDGEGAESFRQFMERVDVTLQKLSNLTIKNIVIFSHAQFIRALLMQQQDPDFRNADYSGKMRMFLEGRRIANAEMVWLDGIGLRK